MPRAKSPITRKSFGIRLNIDLVRELKVLAAKQDSAVNILLEEAIQELLQKYKSPGAKKKGK